MRILKNTTLFILGIHFLMACGDKTKKVTETDNVKPKVVVEKTAIPTAETIFSSDLVRPGNMAITSSGRMFVTMNPLVGPKTKVFEINGSNGKSIAYPNDAYVTGDNSRIKAVVAIRADSKDNLWLLDMAAQEFVVWNTMDEKLVRTIKLSKEVVYDTSFLQDFIIDEKNKRLIIADMTQGDLKSAPKPAFIVVDMETGKSKRMAESHPSMMPEMEGGFALNPIAIDPNFEYVYFGALHGKTLYRVPSASFNSEDALRTDIKKWGAKSYCDGIAVDDNENVYVTNVEEGAIGVSNAQGFKNITMLPEGQSWPDGLYISNGSLYSTVDQLNRTSAMTKGADVSKPPYLVIKTDLVQ